MVISLRSWLLFLTLILGLLAFDLFVFHKKGEPLSLKKSLFLSIFYLAMGLAFGGWIAWLLGKDALFDYLTAYFVEKSLAMDNIFIISLIFSAFHIPNAYQHRILFWGILGVIVFRALMIGLGLEIITHFHWVLYIFGLFLMVTGVKIALTRHSEKPAITHSFFYTQLQRFLPLTHHLHGERFFVKIHEKWHGTPLFSALIMIEIADLIFAVDSIPAVLAITTQAYIVYTSNIFAILGLRALYTVLSVLMDRFIYLKYALAFILVWIGLKIFLVFFHITVPALLSLCLIFISLSLGIGLSMHHTKNNGEGNH